MFWKAVAIGAAGWFALLSYSNSEILKPAIDVAYGDGPVFKSSSSTTSAVVTPAQPANMQGPCGSPLKEIAYLENFRTDASRAMRKDAISAAEYHQIIVELGRVQRGPIRTGEACQLVDQLRRQYAL